MLHENKSLESNPVLNILPPEGGKWTKNSDVFIISPLPDRIPFHISRSQPPSRPLAVPFVGRISSSSPPEYYIRVIHGGGGGASPQEYRYYSVETGQEAARRRVKRKAIRGGGEGDRAGEGVGGGPQKEKVKWFLQ